MKRCGCLTAAIVVAALIGAHASAAPKNVLLFIGDGMGIEAIKAGRYLQNGDTAPLSFETFSYAGWLTHHNITGNVTDSAASGTALATGHKVNNGVISVELPGSGAELTTALEIFKAQGKRTGLVTLGTPITDATPAAFGAHNTSRNNQSDIANDYLAQTRPNVLFGQSHATLLAGAAGAGYTVVTTPAQFTAIDPTSNTHYAGLFTAGQEPLLADMTTTALDILSQNSPDGFFALIENEDTDSGGHSNNISEVANGVIQLSNAVQAAVNWLSNAGMLDDTLILVTADHETGGLTATNNGAGNLPGATWTTGNHTQSPVPVYARGPNAGYVAGYLDNTEIPSILQAMAPPPLTETRTFQEGVNDYAGTHDTQLRADATGTAFGSTTPLVVDLDDNAASGNQPSQALVRFDELFGSGASQIPAGATILNAELLIRTGNAANDQSNTSSSLYRMLVDWDESSTWDSLTSGITANGTEAAATAEGTLVPTTRNALLAFDVTATVQAWANGEANHGWALLANGTDGWRFASAESASAGLRPMLSVTFVVPEPASSWLFVLTVGIAALFLRTRFPFPSTERVREPGRDNVPI
jgi:alkaline phosphatase